MSCIQEDINAIIARGMAMKDRGEKFFESGSREMGTYGKMIVRDLGNFRVPVRVHACDGARLTRPACILRVSVRDSEGLGGQ
jgi:hypothetical protein